MDSPTASAINLLQQKETITTHVRQSGNPISAVAFPNIFIWQDFFDFQFALLEDNLCIFASNEVGTFLYAPPLGEVASPAAIEESLTRMHRQNNGKPVTRIENIPAERLSDFNEKKFLVREKSPDYLYRREDLAQLKGNSYKTHRWAYNNFVENNQATYKPFEDRLAADCMALYKRWAEARAQGNNDAIYRQMLEDNEKVHYRIVNYHKELGLIGRVIEINGKIGGYSFGFPLNGETFCILCEIIDPSLKGAAVFIFREFCRDTALSGFSLINAMDDSDLPNIRRVKESFHPVELLRNFVITPK